VNTRSLKFQLIVWYASLLAGGFVLLGAAAYVALERYLVGAVKESQLRRARQIAQLVTDENKKSAVAKVGDEVEARYAPGLNDRFVRVSRPNGEVIYLSSTPPGFSFSPVTLPPPVWPSSAEAVRRVSLGNRRQMLLTSHTVAVQGGERFLVETGALLDEVQQDLRQWLIFLIVGLPVVAAIAVAGGFFLIKRALTPVDRIAASAERIGSHNLSERLPVAKSGDELERLSITLNHMIQRLEEAFKHSRRFLADASHELRTPLTVLRGELESFVQEPKLAPEMRERVGSALEELERLVNIVEGLFAISRLDAGEAQAELVKFDLGKLASSTTDQMSLLGEDKNIKITCAAANDVWVEGDRARMKQVVVNLLDNAIKYTPKGGAVGLNVRTRDGKAVLEVTDNGMGIPANSLPRVFERFYRVDEARSRELGGAGLGLSIVKSICAAHHGRVEATSTPGEGSVFRVELPLVSAPAIKNNGTQNHES
jgi:heavy metal sensor kinase